jgi:hypothetical protein
MLKLNCNERFHCVLQSSRSTLVREVVCCMKQAESEAGQPSLDPEEASLQERMPPELGCHAAPLRPAQKMPPPLGPDQATQLGHGAFYHGVDDGGAHKVCTQVHIVFSCNLIVILRS